MPESVRIHISEDDGFYDRTDFRIVIVFLAGASHDG